jgi:glucose/mannose-6-phosphate isomerase
MLDDLKMIHERDTQDMLGGALRRWQAVAQSSHWDPQVATSRNQAKQLALELMGKTVVIYSTRQLHEAAESWKTSLNQYAKQLAWCGELSDAEILGWTKQPVNKQYAVVELRSNLDDAAERRRFEAVERYLSGMRPAPLTVDSEGQAAEQQVAYCLALGDFVAIYLALLNGLDPAARDIIDKVNRELA